MSFHHLVLVSSTSKLELVGPIDPKIFQFFDSVGRDHIDRSITFGIITMMTDRRIWGSLGFQALSVLRDQEIVPNR